MQYLLLIYSHDAWAAFDRLDEDEKKAVFAEYMALAERPDVVSSLQLQPADTATTVRVQDDRTLTSDGPFAETKEVIGGYYLLEADNLDDAIELAAQIPAARMGGVIEVRPVVER